VQIVEQRPRCCIDRRIAVPALDLDVEAADLAVDVQRVAGEGGSERRHDAIYLGLCVTKLLRLLEVADLLFRPAPSCRERRAGAQVAAQREQTSPKVRNPRQGIPDSRIEMCGDRRRVICKSGIVEAAARDGARDQQHECGTCD
jgi:hypothetical protein